jgi:hypothetical protein
MFAAIRMIAAIRAGANVSGGAARGAGSMGARVELKVET